MKQTVVLCAIALLVIFGGCKKRENYDSLPKELAELCQKIDKDPQNGDLYFERATYYYGNGFIDEGLKDIREAIKIDSTKSSYYVLLSDFYFAQTETDLSEESLEKAILLDPKNNEARLKLGELYFHLKMFDQSMSTTEEAIHLNEFNPKAYLTRAFCYKAQEDTINMLRMLHKVIDQDPKEKKAYLELGYFYQQQHNPIAIDYYKNALTYYPHDVEINLNLARMYEEIGEIEMSKEQYNTVISFAPSNTIAYNGLGYLYLKYEDKYDDAIRYFTQAISIDSSFVNAICNRGLAFELQGKYDFARQDYMYSRRISPNFMPAINGLNRLDKIKK